jgi:general secretion pathway protein E
MSQTTIKDHRLTLPEVVDALVAEGLVAGPEAEKFKLERRYFKGDTHPLVIIAGQRWKSLQPPHRVLDLEFLTQWMANWCGLDYLHIDPLKINLAAVTGIMSSTYATRFCILPVEVKPNEVVIATAEPFQRDWEAEMRPILRKDIRRVISSPEEILRYQVEFYNLAKFIKGALDKGDVSGGASNFEQLVELGKSNKQFDANDQHIVRIVDWLWQYAFEQRASDIHVEPRRGMGIVRFRIDGVLHQVHQIPMTVLNAMTSRIKILGRMDVIEKRRPQDGRIKTRTQDGQEVELRLSTLPTAFGEKLVMRIFDPDVLVRDFSELGFAPEEAATWYTTLKNLATPEVNVCTLEDPIEMVEGSFNQVQILPDIGMGFAEGIRALMRQDPDIIMVGEIRDLQTADMAIQAALTGHLVLSTLHTNDAPSAITRLVELGVPPYLLSATVLGVMAQRLIRTLCPQCKQPGGMRAEDEAAWTALVAPWKSTMPTQLYHPVGCLDCRKTGYKGRVGIYEIMPMSAEIMKLVSEGAELTKLREQAMREGMKPLRIAGAKKVAAGLTTIAEVIKVAPPMFDGN